MKELLFYINNESNPTVVINTSIDVSNMPDSDTANPANYTFYQDLLIRVNDDFDSDKILTFEILDVSQPYSISISLKEEFPNITFSPEDKITISTRFAYNYKDINYNIENAKNLFTEISHNGQQYILNDYTEVIEDTLGSNQRYEVNTNITLPLIHSSIVYAQLNSDFSSLDDVNDLKITIITADRVETQLAFNDVDIINNLCYCYVDIPIIPVDRFATTVQFKNLGKEKVIDGDLAEYGVYDISMASGFYSLEEVTFLSDREYMDSVYSSAILSSSDYTICTDYHYGEFMLAMRMEYVKNMLP